MHAVSGLGIPEPGRTSLVLALALWLVALAPHWILVLLLAKHLARLREAVASNLGWKLLAAGACIGAVFLAESGTVWVCRDLLGPKQTTVQGIVWNATLVQEALLVLAVILASRRRAGGDAPAPSKRRQPARR